MKGINFCIILLVMILLSITAYSFDEDSEVSIGVKRGVKVKQKTGVKRPAKKEKKEIKFFKINTKKTFEKVKKQNTLVFMIGNDKYQMKSGFGKLEECFSDVILLKQIFIHCVKIDEKNIYANKDLTLQEFKKRIKGFLEKIKKNKTANVIITYSGHGNDDGSLVFVDGGMYSPKELKALVNSYKNDTILMIDACYSGNNEGPKEMLKGVKKDEFKSNSVRVYASLAHLSAKEIKYNNTFFSHAKQFHKETLKIKKRLGGNGYFTAMIGLFFSEYKFKEDENISFKDLVSYVTNRGKQYVEFLAMWGKESKAQKKFAKLRLNQQPKILPVQERVDFLDENHQFILIQKPIMPVGMEPGISVGVFFPMGNLGKNYKSPSLIASIFTGYKLDFISKKLYASFNFSYMSLSTRNSTVTRQIGLSVIAGSLGVKYFPVSGSFFTLSVGVNAGPAFTFASYGSFGPLREEKRSLTNLFLDGELMAKFKIFKDFYVILPVRYLLINYKEDPLSGLSVALGASYYF